MHPHVVLVYEKMTYVCLLLYRQQYACQVNNDLAIRADAGVLDRNRTELKLLTISLNRIPIASALQVS